MELYINGDKIDITLEGEKTVRDVLVAVEQEAAANEATTLGIKVDGREIPAGEIDGLSEVEIQDSTKIEIRTLCKSDILEALSVEKGNFLNLVEKLPQVQVNLQAGKDKEANETISELAVSIDEFCHTITLSALFPDVYNNLKADGKTMTEFFEEFSEIFRDFEESLANKDTVTSGDLCEYEIAPRLELLAKAVDNLSAE